MKILLYRHRLTADQSVQLDRAVATFHDAQDEVVLVDAGERRLPVRRDLVNFHRDILRPQPPDQPEITATGLRLDDNWFTHTENGCSVMTLTDWQIAFLQEIEDDDDADLPPFPTAAPDAYLLQSLTLITFLLLAGANDYDFFHEATTGCIADFCADKRTRAIKMRAGYVCPRCDSKASAAGVSPVALDAVRVLAECVRALAVGRRPQSRAARISADDDDWIDRAALPEGMQLPQTLMDACRRRRLNVVVGSGLSLQSDVDVVFPKESEWTTLPTWSEIPSRLASSLKRYRNRTQQPREAESLDEFLTDMDYFRTALGAVDYYPRAILDAFVPVVRSPGRANRLIFRLPARWVLTTNYDLILNHAAPQGTSAFTWREAREARALLERSEGTWAPLVKIHGCATRADTVILTKKEYDFLRGDAAYASMMRSAFESAATLFVGFGMTDPFDVDLALREAEHAGAAQGEKFALLPRSRVRDVRDRFPQVNVLAYEDSALVPSVLACMIRESAN